MDCSVPLKMARVIAANYLDGTSMGPFLGSSSLHPSITLRLMLTEFPLRINVSRLFSNNELLTSPYISNVKSMQ